MTHKLGSDDILLPGKPIIIHIVKISSLESIYLVTFQCNTIISLSNHIKLIFNLFLNQINSMKLTDSIVVIIVVKRDFYKILNTKEV